MEKPSKPQVPPLQADEDEITKRYGGPPDVCRVLAEMVEVMDEHYDRRDAHYARRENMLERIVKRLQMGLILIGLIAIVVNFQLYRLVGSVGEEMKVIGSNIGEMRTSILVMQQHMTEVAQEMGTVSRNMVTMSEAIVPISTHVGEINTSLRDITNDMHGINRNLVSLDGKMTALPLMQQDMQRMTFGMYNVTQDTRAISSPFRMMPWSQ